MSSFPPNLQNLNDSTGTVPMIDGPDLDAGVFIRLLRNTVVLGRGTEDDGEVDGKDGDILILRWSDAKPLVDSGTAELV
jgi:GINS complex subunit 4